jgi:hypothetical protein
VPEHIFRDGKMKYNRLNTKTKNFFSNKSGETAVQTSLIFSAAVVLGVIFGVPMISDASKEYAYQKQFGIDPVQTSSVGEAEKEVKTYTVRKSIFDKPE